MFCFLRPLREGNCLLASLLLLGRRRIIVRTAEAFRFEQRALLSPRVRAHFSPERKQSGAASTGVVTRAAKTNMAALEVEEKFSLEGRDLSELAHALKKQGFELASETTIVDWYLDVTENSSYALLRRDCWLRCRQSRGRRTWQLKRGQTALGSSSLRSSRGRATVYEEIEGIEGLKRAFSLLATMNQTAGVPDVNIDEDFENSLQESITNGGPAIRFSYWNLDPFAKIVSRRSSWKVTETCKQTSPFCDLCVDIDVTDSGYAIGEVEAVVAGADKVFDAETLITKLVDQIGGSSDVKAEGKLEYFLRTNRPDVYQICIDNGLL